MKNDNFRYEEKEKKMKNYSKQKREQICNPTRNSNFLKRFKRTIMAIYKKNDDIGATK